MKRLCVILGVVLALCAFGADKGEKMQIQLSLNDEKTIVELENNPATRDFYELLPLRLTFSDYVGKEKVSHEKLQKRLNTSGLSGYTPQVGDLFYFAPWGNLGIFYDKQPFHSGLVRFGNVGANFLAKIKAQKDDFEIKFEKVVK